MSRRIEYKDIPRDGLVLELPLDGNANASVGSNGTATNVTWGTDGTIGYQKGYGIFNGTSSNIDISSFTQSSIDRTISFWIKQVSNSTTVYVFDSQTGRLIISPGNGVTGQNNWSLFDGTWRNFSTPINTSNWEFVTITFVGTTANLYINGVFKNSVTYTQRAIGGTTKLMSGYGTGSNVNGNLMLFRIYNKVLSQDEITNLYKEGLRKLGPTSALIRKSSNNDFPKYSLPSLESGKVLEISKPKVGSNYINQVNGDIITSTNATDGTVGLNNSIALSSGTLTWSSISFSTSCCWELVSGKWTLQINPAYITSTGITSTTKTLSNIMLWNRVLTSVEQQQLKYSNYLIT